MSPNAAIPLNTNEPLYIVELGTGSGKFSFFMLKALEKMKEVCGFPFERIVYVMTDFTENNFKFWQDQPDLKPYFESGRLDAAIFDAVQHDSIQLWKSKVVLGPGSSVNPICIVANYLFDTLYHDMFQVDGGVLKEGLVSTGSKNVDEPDPLEPDIIARLDNRYLYKPIKADYYSLEGGFHESEDGDEFALRRILKWYENYFRNNAQGASFLMPIGALRALRRLCRISNQRVLVISGDKGNNHPDHFIGLVDPHIAVHGSFSLMVNYHAIGAYFTNKGGFALHNPQEEASLKVGCFVMMGNEKDPSSQSADFDELWVGDALDQKDIERSAGFPHLKQAFEDVLNQFGPNDFFVLQKSLKEDIANPPLRTVIALLKLSCWDPDVFYKFRDVILTQAPASSSKLRNDLARGIPSVWENYYMMDLEKDIAFEIGRFYYGIRDFANALKFYAESTRTFGEHHVTFHNQGLCYYSLGKREVSLEYFTKALALNGDYEKARSWIEKVNRELTMLFPVAPIVSSTAASNQNSGSENDNNSNQFAVSSGIIMPPAAPSDDNSTEPDSVVVGFHKISV